MNFFSSALYQSIERSVREGVLDPYLANLLMPCLDLSVLPRYWS